MEKLKKYGKFVVKGLAVIGGIGAVAGSSVISIAGIPVAGALAGVVAVSSALSSLFKDKQSKPIVTLVMKLINLFAINIDNAENDKKVNGVKELKKKGKICQSLAKQVRIK